MTARYSRLAPLLLALVLMTESPVAFAAIGVNYTLTGIGVALANAQAILSAPPLPSLERNKEYTVAAQAGLAYGKISEDNEYIGPPASDKWHYDGRFSGQNYAIGVTTRSLGPLALFGIFTEGKMSGDVDTKATHTTLKDVNVQGTAFAGGLSCRLLGDDKSSFAAGMLAGYTFMHFDMVFHEEQELPAPKLVTRDFHSSPEIRAYVLGVQAKQRIGSFLISPYVLYFKETSNACRHFDPPSGAIYDLPACDGDVHAVNIPATFAAYGLNLGWRDLVLNVYSGLDNDDSLAFIKMTSYRLSYSLSF